MSRKIFSFQFESQISKQEYDDICEFNSGFNRFFKSRKRQLSTSNFKCKRCKKKFKDMVDFGNLICPCCYESIYKKIKDDKFDPSLIECAISTFFLNLRNKDFNYQGRIPDYARPYFDLKNKVEDLERELLYCIEKEDYKKCVVIKETLDDSKKKLAKLKENINE
ncbi:MAG: hypothetical protein MRZ16_03210 [Parvimonas sp.]|uniref:hypothetical protein n=1 Tax=Parvimonas sp. TaxID=1944660 RepID=UPI0025F623BA|nr:hypothetical protein [Parvimonas sp.]MCI5997219.1 hypothetical protein [Parvimonas sp.]